MGRQVVTIVNPTAYLNTSDTTIISENVTVFITKLFISVSDITTISEFISIQEIGASVPVIGASLTLQLGFSLSGYSLQTGWSQSGYVLSKKNPY